MGGAAKGMMHPYDDYEISFSSMANLIMSVSLGNIDVSEKVDGINIFWYLHKDRSPRFALSIGECKARGITLNQLKDKLKTHPGRHQFLAGAEAIKYRALNGMRWVGPGQGQHWVNTEIIYTKNPQTFQYDHDALVYHDYCMLNKEKKAMVSIRKVYPREWRFFIEKELKDSRNNPWKLYQKLPLKLPSRPTSSFVTKALVDLEEIRKRYSCSFEDSILKCYIQKTREELQTLGLKKEHVEQLCSNIWHPGYSKFDIKKIKKEYSDIDFEKLDKIALSKNRQGYQGKCKEDLRRLFDAFGAKIIEPLKSNIISDKISQQERLQKLMHFNELVIERNSKSHPEVAAGLSKNMQRFFVLGVNCPVIEGIVLIFENKKYKITGAFPSMNRVCGASRYELQIEYSEKLYKNICQQ